MDKVDFLTGLPGFRDYYPESWNEIDFILSKMREISLKFGYQEYDGPSLEKVELIEAKSGEGLMKEIFQLKDRYGNRLLLRPEQTPTLSRMLAKEQQRYKRPMRWFTIPRLFRDETVQKGRVREFWQLNVDILGEDSIAADAEVIAVAAKIIEACGIDFSQFNIFINHRNLLSSFLESVTSVDSKIIIPIIDKRLSFIQDHIEALLSNSSISTSDSKDKALVYRRILISSGDFREKLIAENRELIPYLDDEEAISRRVMIDQFNNLGIEQESAEKIYNFISAGGTPEEFFENISKLDLPETVLPIIDEFKIIHSYLVAYGVSQSLIFDTSLARGLDYYTGFVFEMFDSTGEIVRALCGGGRYSDLVETIGGSPLSGTGFGMGETVLLELAKLRDTIPNLKPSWDIYVAPIKKVAIPKCIELTELLRSKFTVFNNPFAWKLKRHFESADLNNVKLTLLIGPKDLESNVVTVRKMSDGSNITLDIDSNLEKRLNELINQE